MPISLRKFVRHPVVGGEMVRLAARVPACRKRREYRLFEVFQDIRHAAGQIVVEQHHAGVEVRQPKPVAAPHQRLQRQRAAVGQLESRWAAVISGSRLPMRTCIPACLRMVTICATFCR